jgi:hypothetical protein
MSSTNASKPAEPSPPSLLPGLYDQAVKLLAQINREGCTRYDQGFAGELVARIEAARAGRPYR